MGVAEGTPVFLLTAKVFGAKELRTKTSLLLLDQRTTGFARAFFDRIIQQGDGHSLPGGGALD